MTNQQNTTWAAVTTRSVLVIEATGDGTHLGQLLHGRLQNTRRFPEKETMLLVFKAFKYVLNLQPDTLHREGCILGDLHDNSLTVMAGGQHDLDVTFARWTVAGS